MTENEHEIIFLAPPCFGDERYWCQDDAVVDCDCPDGPHPWIRYERALEASQQQEAVEGETLEQYADRIVSCTKKAMLDRLDDDVIGGIKESHLIFGKACAMEAVTTAMREMADKIAEEKAATPPSEATLKSKLDEAVELLEPFGKLAEEIEALCAIYTGPESDPHNWAKSCEWDDLRKIPAFLATMKEPTP